MSEAVVRPDLTAALAATAGGIWVPLRFDASFPGACCAGPAITVSLTRGDNRALHRALEAARAGDVIVAAGTGDGEAGHWGGLMTRVAISRGLGGLIVDAAVRDRAELRLLGWPVFFRSTCPRKAAKQDPGTVGAEIELGGVEIATGDLIVADEDGVVVVPAARAEAVSSRSAAIARQEAELERAIVTNGRLCP